MQINTKTMNIRVREYIAGPDSKRVWEILVNSILFNVLCSLFLIPVALILTCSLILAREGIMMLFRIIRSFITLEVFRDPRREYLENSERIRPLILSSIISGPNRHALMLGTLSDETQRDTSFLQQKAAEFGDIYLDESSDECGELFDMLRDDDFQFFRRRSVPASHSEGRDLILFDITYRKDELHLSEDNGVWLAAVLTIDNKDDGEEQTDSNDPPPGRIVQIPWKIVEDSISD